MISPEDTFTLFLDEHLPEAERQPEARRPALVYRYGTAGELREHERRLADVNRLQGEAYITAVEERARFNLVAVRNLTTPDGRPTEALAEALTLRDLKAVAQNIALCAELSETDQKKSASPSPSEAAASAEPVSPDASA